jgi:hypothetical protein
MALIQNVEPDLRALVGYIVARARERRVTLNRARLVKLLYLVDVENVRTRRQPVTGVAWVFADFGPHSEGLDAALAELERGTALYRALQDDAPDGEDWVSGTRRTVDSVVERFAALPLNALLDHVYFHTGPMAAARRGDVLDMSRARDDAGPRRPLPLRSPARPADVDTRLAAWRASGARRSSLLRLDPPAGLLDDPDRIVVTGRVRGQLQTLPHDPMLVTARVRGRLQAPPQDGEL